jgi:CDP-diacylglycerol--glycerol-3-phosphate 3-phosphatidyltransferase
MYLTIANIITVTRILLILPFTICLLKDNDTQQGTMFRWIGIGIFALIAVSDALDGYLARSRKQVTHLGTFLDPLADKLMITVTAILLALPQTSISGFRLPFTVVVLILGKDVLLLLGFAVTYFMTQSIHIKPVWAGKASTFFQIVMVSSILIGPEMTRWLGFWPIWTRIVWWMTAFLAITATFVYICRGIRYIETFHSEFNGVKR